MEGWRGNCCLSYFGTVHAIFVVIDYHDTTRLDCVAFCMLLHRLWLVSGLEQIDEHTARYFLSLCR